VHALYTLYARLAYRFGTPPTSPNSRRLDGAHQTTNPHMNPTATGIRLKGSSSIGGIAKTVPDVRKLPIGVPRLCVVVSPDYACSTRENAVTASPDYAWMALSVHRLTVHNP
jgi:hypothetical protein